MGSELGFKEDWWAVEEVETATVLVKRRRWRRIGLGLVVKRKERWGLWGLRIDVTKERLRIAIDVWEWVLLMKGLVVWRRRRRGLREIGSIQKDDNRKRVTHQNSSSLRLNRGKGNEGMLIIYFYFFNIRRMGRRRKKINELLSYFKFNFNLLIILNYIFFIYLNKIYFYYIFIY